MPPVMPIQWPMHRGTLSEPAAWFTALMELFHDKGRMLTLITIAFLRLRAAYPDLKPWGFGQRITDTNPDVLRNGFLAENCIHPYWKRKYGDRICSIESGASFTFYCRHHKRVETQKNVSQQLPLQLAAGLFNYSDWVFLVAKLTDKTLRLRTFTHFRGLFQNDFHDTSELTAKFRSLCVPQRRERARQRRRMHEPSRHDLRAQQQRRASAEMCYNVRRFCMRLSTRHPHPMHPFQVQAD